MISLSFWTELLEVLKSVLLFFEKGLIGIVQLLDFIPNALTLTRSMRIAIPVTVGLVIDVAIIVGVANILIRGFGSNG